MNQRFMAERSQRDVRNELTYLFGLTLAKMPKISGVSITKSIMFVGIGIVATLTNLSSG